MKFAWMVLFFASAVSNEVRAQQMQFGPQPQQRAVTVTGSCLRSILPDRGAVTITANILEPDMGAASKKAMDLYDKMKKGVKALNLKDLEMTTTESTFFEEHEWQKDRQVSKGFRARMGLQASTTETARLGEVIALATKLGVKQVSGLSMFLSPERMKAERESCLEEAVKNARSKADSVAKAAGVKLGRVLNVQEGSQNDSPPPRPMYSAMREAKMADAAPSLESAPERITVDVLASFALD